MIFQSACERLAAVKRKSASERRTVAAVRERRGWPAGLRPCAIGAVIVGDEAVFLSKDERRRLRGGDGVQRGCRGKARGGSEKLFHDRHFLSFVVFAFLRSSCTKKLRMIFIKCFQTN